MAQDRFADLKTAPLPPVPRLWAGLGPGIVWMALAQGSGELYYWPYFVAKYGALYVCLLLPACVLQMPVNLEIGRYTLLTGESVFSGFARLGRGFGIFMWVAFAVNFIFIRAMVIPPAAPSLPADPKELDRFITMICYSGLGGFWSLFYSFWIREKGFGMAAYADHITSPITGKKELAELRGFRFEDTPENKARYRGWLRTLLADNAVGVVGNLFTTFLMAFLAFSVLHPQGKVPEGWRVAAEQGEFFRVLWGPAGRIAFLVIAGFFLADSWLAGVDAVSRVHAEMTCTYVPGERAKGMRFWYYLFLVVMLGVTWAVLPYKDPDTVLTLTGVMSLFAVAVYSAALGVLNYVELPKRFPAWIRPGAVQRALFVTVAIFYLAAAAYYLWVRLLGRA